MAPLCFILQLLLGKKGGGGGEILLLPGGRISQKQRRRKKGEGGEVGKGKARIGMGEEECSSVPSAKQDPLLSAW